MGCCSEFKKEFRCKNFLFNHEKPHVFVTGQCVSRHWYTLWVTLASIGHTVILVLDALDYSEDNGNSADFTWLLFLSHWTYLLLVLMNYWDLASVLYVHGFAEYLLGTAHGMKDVPMPWFLKINWALHTAGSVASITVGVVYWTYLHLKFTGFTWDVYAIHAANAIFAVLHLLISRKPIRLLHVYVPITFFGVYMSFNRAYEYYSGNEIYPNSKWDDIPGNFENVILLVLLLGPFFHIFVYLLVLFRNYCLCACCHDNRVDAEDAESVSSISSRSSVPTPETFAKRHRNMHRF